MKLAVVGAGSWGTALASVLAANGHDVCIWARNAEVVETINTQHFNPRYLSDVVLSERLHASLSYEEVFDGAHAAVIVTPSKIFREVAQAIAPYASESLPILLCSKGIEEASGKVGVEVFEDVLGNASRLAVLSGPNHAEEVILGIPAATVIAAQNEDVARFFQDCFASNTFRTYLSEDVMGVELCAAFKNVIAIAVGISYGIGFGDNTAAMIQTRGLAEMSRLVVSCGGQALTCMGLAGAGDLVVTCMSKHSRNRRFGEMIAAGLSLDDFTEQTHMVAEGAYACKALNKLAKQREVDLPITALVNAIVWEGANLEEEVAKLTERPLNKEFY